MNFLTLDILALVLLHLLSIGAVCHVLLTKRDPRSALGWTVALVFLPILGLVAYFLFGISRAESRAERIMRRLATIGKQYGLNACVRKDEHFPSAEEECLDKLAHKLIGLSLCPGNLVSPLHNGDEAYPAMLEAIDSARHHVFLGTYIFNYGQVAKKFIDALTAAHERGVDVRVLVDGVGALYSWRKPIKILAQRGIKTTRFRPPRIFPPNFGINLRSHRKVLICDTTGFVGGMNISDGNLLRLHPNRKHHIQDMHFRCEGPIVNQLCRAFLLNWSFCTESFSPPPPICEEAKGECLCRVVVDGPGDDADVLDDLVCGAINIARKSIYIMTPYFLPPPELMSALRSAAQRGVDVRVILPEKNNLFYMNWATQRILPLLLNTGVRIWYQAPPFAHTKLLTVDGFYSLVGSANLDNRSLKLNFELNMEVYNEDFHNRLADFMACTMANGREITLEEIKAASFPARLRNAACWIFSPYF